MNTQNLEFAEQAAITASAVPDELRIGFWPQHFGSVPQWITLESCIFDWMDRLCTDYHGGIWSFLTLSNGGAFMAPESEHDEKWGIVQQYERQRRGTYWRSRRDSRLSDDIQPPRLSHRV